MYKKYTNTAFNAKLLQKLLTTTTTTSNWWEDVSVCCCIVFCGFEKTVSFVYDSSLWVINKKKLYMRFHLFNMQNGWILNLNVRKMEKWGKCTQNHWRQQSSSISNDIMCSVVGRHSHNVYPTKGLSSLNLLCQCLASFTTCTSHFPTLPPVVVV